MSAVPVGDEHANDAESPEVAPEDETKKKQARQGCLIFLAIAVVLGLIVAVCSGDDDSDEGF